MIHHRSYSANVRISVVIPSSDGRRAGNVDRLLDCLEHQTLRDLEVIVVCGVSPQGRAINMGVDRACGEYLVILDDDSILLDDDTLESLIAVLKSNADIGMVGASIVQPEDATRFERAVARALPRFSMPLVADATESDMPCHGCCAFPMAVFRAVGGEPDGVPRGLDPILRHRIRTMNYRIVLAPNTRVAHPVPGTFAALARMFYRNGKGSATIQRRSPELVFDTHEKLEWDGNGLRRPFLLRAVHYPIRWLGYLATGKLIRALGDVFYGMGYLHGVITSFGSNIAGVHTKPPTT